MQFRTTGLLLLGAMALPGSGTAQTTPAAPAITRTVVAATKLPTVTDVPLHFKAVSVTLQPDEEFLGAVAHQAGLAPRLIPIPFAVRHALARVSEILPSPLLTRNQVELMQIDSVSSPEMPGFVELGISPHSVQAILQKMLTNCG